MMSPTPSQICVANEVPFTMEVTEENSNVEELEQISLDDCDIKRTIILDDDDSVSLSEKLDENEEDVETSTEIVKVLPNSHRNYSVLRTDDTGQQFLTVEDLTASGFDTMPLLAVTHRLSNEDCGDWSEVGETLEVSDDMVEDVKKSSEIIEVTPSFHSIILESPEEVSEEGSENKSTLCIFIDGQPYNIIPTHQIVVEDDSEETNEVEKQKLKGIKLKSSVVNSSKEQKLVKKKNHPCNEPGCNRSYSSLYHLKVHMRKHEGFRPFMCPIEGCDKAFAEMYSCITHIRTHTGEKPYKCMECGKGFKTSGDLLKHTRTHTGERPFKCPIEGCDKAFTTADIRKIHIRSHTGEKPFVCGVAGCERKFSSSTNCKNHMRIHTGEKPYACPVEGCVSRFTEYSSLYKHRNVHKQKEIQKENSHIGGKSFRVASHFPRKAVTRTRQNSVKKIDKSVKDANTSLLNLQDIESDDLNSETLNMTLGDDNFEIYHLIFNDNLKM